MNREDAALRIKNLNRELARHDRLYYVEARPEITDREYDALFDELRALEEAFPDLRAPDSATLRVGSDLAGDLPEVEHAIPVLSLDKAYSPEEVLSWVEKISSAGEPMPAVVVEEKIDGSSIVLYYEQGVLARAVTRGNGRIGNDVTANVRTIRSIPLSLPKPVDLVVRGEIYIPVGSFREYNERMDGVYANPRNLAAGTLRNIRSSLAASVPLEAFVYEGFYPDAPDSHIGVLKRLAQDAFRTNPSVGFFCDDPAVRNAASSLDARWTVSPLSGIGDYLAGYAEKRAALGYEIDGLVIKADRTALRESLGYTAHHPRWAIAYKFESPQAVTRMHSVTLQIGRNGRATPVAELEPVGLAGTTISRATLHNQDYINQLELAPGDTVSISRRGDVIPAVEAVIEKGDGHVWSMPETCPECGTLLVKTGAHHFCPNRSCPARLIGRLVHFTGKAGLDIDGLGEKTIRFLFSRFGLSNPEQLLRFDFERLIGEDGFGEKKVRHMQEGLRQALEKPFPQLLGALGLEGIGRRSAEALVSGGFNSMEKLLDAADREDMEAIASVEGFGEILAKQLVGELQDPEMRSLIDLLDKTGFILTAAADTVPAEGPFSGQIWCVTGSFDNFKPRDLAADRIRSGGGRVGSSVTGKTTHLLAGEKAGSKLEKARALGVTIVDEETFLGMLG